MRTRHALAYPHPSTHRRTHSYLAAQADGALAYVSSLLPSFHEDMSLIEHLDELLETARKKARTELTRNGEVGGGWRQCTALLILSLYQAGAL